MKTQEILVLTEDNGSRESCSVFYASYYLVSKPSGFTDKELADAYSYTRDENIDYDDEDYQDDDEIEDKVIADLQAAGFTVEQINPIVECFSL